MIYDFAKDWNGYDQWPFKAIVVAGDSTWRITKQDEIVNVPINRLHLNEMIKDGVLIESEDEELYQHVAKLLLENGKII